jgi:type II secretory pathway pseudopilin PulG
MSRALLRHLADRVHGRHGGHRSVASGVPANDRGFALTEVIVAGLIFAIVSTAAVLAITGGLTGSTKTNQRVVTANVAQQAVQQAVDSPRASLTATPTTTTTATVGSGTYVVRRSISYYPAGATACPNPVATDTPYSIVVHVTAAPSASPTRTVAMDTVIAC